MPMNTPRNKLLLGGAGAGAAVLLIGWLLYSWLFSSPKIEDDFKYFPENCSFVFSANVEELLASDAFKKLKKEFPDVEKEMEGDSSNAMGVRPTNFARVSMGGGMEGSKETIGVIRLKKATTADEIKSKKESKFHKDVKYNEVSVGKNTIHEETYELNFGFGGGKGERTKGDAFCLLDGKQMIIGESLAAVRKILEREKKTEISDGMKEALKQANFSKTIAWAVNLKALLKDEKAADELKRNLRLIPGGSDLLKGLHYLAGDVAVGSDLRCNVVLMCEDAKRAEDVKKLIDGTLVLAKTTVKEIKEVPAEIAGLLDDIKISQNGTRVIGSLTFKPDAAIQLIKKQQEEAEKPRPKFKTVPAHIGGDKKQDE